MTTRMDYCDTRKIGLDFTIQRKENNGKLGEMRELG
jgi:hypothetical protein